MTLRPVLPLALLALVVACSAETPSELGRASASRSGSPAAGAQDDDDADDADDSGFGTPNDDPALGGEPDRDETEPPMATPPRGNDCVVGGYYCGGDKVSGNAKTLYRCNGPGTPTVVQRCTRGCTVNPGRDDSCAVDPSARVASPVPGKVVTYPFGAKNSRYAAGYHTGDDYSTPTGSSAVAVRSGTIRWSNDAGGAYGKWMGLDADNGRTYVYCHLSSRLVAAGTRVSAGQVIARTGATGKVTGPHLHFEDHPLGNFVYAQVRKPQW